MVQQIAKMSVNMKEEEELLAGLTKEELEELNNEIDDPDVSIYLFIHCYCFSFVLNSFSGFYRNCNNSRQIFLKTYFM